MSPSTRGLPLQRLVPARSAAALAAAVVVLLGVAAPLAPAAAPAPATAPATDEFAPTEEQADASRDLARRLQRVHYLGLPVDDDLSTRVFDTYLDALDPGRAYLLAADLAEFEPWRDTLDDALQSGDLDPAFTMFNRLHDRQLVRLTSVVETLEGDLDALPFGAGETLDLDRREAPWASSQEELDTFWRKRLASDVIGLQLADRSLEKAQEMLLERYREQIRRAGQYHGRDVFQLFMSALTSSYDPHTQYLVPRLAEDFDLRMSLTFQGIGALLQPDGEYARVARIIVAGPADKHGELQAGDRIVGVAQGKDGPVVDIVGWRLDDAVQLIRGERGSIVRLSVLAADLPESAPPRTIVITRDEVKLEEQAARSEVVEVDEVAHAGGSEGTNEDAVQELAGADRPLRIGVIDLPTFYMDAEAANRGDPDYKSSTRDVARLLEQMTEDGVDGVVLDLRGNGGGSLTEAHELSGLLLGRKPIVQVRESDGEAQVLYGSGHAVWDGPLVVLVDRLSASASEIVAAAIQDHRRGLVCGERTFGKGTVQAVTRAANGRLLVTVAKFYRVTGESTQHAGVTPDIEFPATHDPEEIGESSMDGALAWDRINALQMKGRAWRTSPLPSLVPGLRAQHEARVVDDPDFLRLERELALMREVRDDTVVALDLETRREEQETYEERREEILADWRRAKGFPEPTDVDGDRDVAADATGDRDADGSKADGDAGEPTAGDGETDDPRVAAAEGEGDVEDADADEADAGDRPRRVDAWLQAATNILSDLAEQLDADPELIPARRR